MTKTLTLTKAEIWRVLDEVPDPEIPVVSLVEMGVIRDVEIGAAGVTVTMTPTFSGCPALLVMETDIIAKLQEFGIEHIEVRSTFEPPWTSEWISPAAREKLKGIGLAPPPRHNGNFELVILNAAECPYCGSVDTIMQNSFGPTPCRMIFTCNNCTQPFEQFKPL